MSRNKYGQPYAANGAYNDPAVRRAIREHLAAEPDFNVCAGLGAALPVDGSLSDATHDYCVALCGFVVRYPAGRWSEVGKPVMDAHNAAQHPLRHAENVLSDQMSDGW